MNDNQFDPELIKQLRERILSKKEELAARPADIGLVPLKIACTMASCSHGRHCLDYLRRPRKHETPVAPGSCRDCGAPVVAMPEPQNHRYGEQDELLNTCLNQQHELIRAHYWHVLIDQWAYNQARRLGRAELCRRIERKVVYAMTSRDMWAGRIAPYSKNIVAYAQHATATCCRSCAAYWHGLPRDRLITPTSEQLEHVVWVALTWLDVRLPDLPDAGQPVSGISVSDLPTIAELSSIDDSVINRLSSGHDPTGLLIPDCTSLRIEPARSSLTVARTLDVEPTE